MIKYQKKPLLLEMVKPAIIKQEANKKHNEVTVAKIQFALPTRNLTFVTEKLIKKVKKATSGYGNEVKVEFNFNQQAPAFIYTCKGKTERRSDDKYDEKTGIKIALAKARAQGLTIAYVILEQMIVIQENMLNTLEGAQGHISSLNIRETMYVKEH